MSDPDPVFHAGPVSAADRFEACADAFVQAVIDHLKDERGVHVETALTAAGSVAGFLLLRDTGIDVSALAPGSMVLGTGVDETGPAMVGFLAERCVREGIDPASGWADAVGTSHASLVPAIDLVRDLRPAFDGLAGQFGVPADRHAQVAAAAAVRLARMGERALDPGIGKAIVLASLLAASKTVPHPAGTGSHP